MKHEWRKHEKQYYLSRNNPEVISIPEFGFYTIEGEGNPSSNSFLECVQALYAASYGVKMSCKKGMAPKGYFYYTVYPLEGVWDINEEAKKNFTGVLDKNTFVYKLMIRQPDFVDEEFASIILEHVRAGRDLPKHDDIKFERIEEGTCIQMMHRGSYDNEPASFKLMEDYAASMRVNRISKVHREIYLSDARRVAPEKLKTVLRFQVHKI